MGNAEEPIGWSRETVGPSRVGRLVAFMETFVCMVVEDMTSSIDRLLPVRRRRCVLEAFAAEAEAEAEARVDEEPGLLLMDAIVGT